MDDDDAEAALFGDDDGGATDGGAPGEAAPGEAAPGDGAADADTEDDEDDEDELTLDALVPGEADLHAMPPTLARVDELVAEYHARWVRPNIRCDAASAYVFETLGIDASTHVSWDAFQERFRPEVYRLVRLNGMLAHFGVRSGETRNRLNEVSYALHALPRFVIQTANLMSVVAPLDRTRNEVLLPEHFRAVGGDREGQENILDYDAVKNTTFQSAFLYLREILQGHSYRRADGRLFSRIVTASGHQTLAFREEMTIEAFVRRFTAHQFNFEAFRWVTNPLRNLKDLITYLRECVLPEARDLDEDCRYRSYEGDAVGRGAGVYDCREDFFFPYALRPQWEELAERATQHICLIRGVPVRRRRRAGDDDEGREEEEARGAYRLEPPPDTAVCVVHLPGAFPYHTAQELEDVAAQPRGAVWREADAFEAAAAGAECRDAPELARLLAARLPPDATEPEVWGRAWIPVLPPKAQRALHDGTWTHLNPPGAPESALAHAVRAGGTNSVPWELLDGVHAKCYLTHRDGTALVPLPTPARRMRASVSKQEVRAHLQGAPLGPHAIVTLPAVPAAEAEGPDGEGEDAPAPAPARYFRVDAGRTWRDCAAEDVDRIYHCQEFTPHDMFMLYALKGRLFFDVADLDNYEMTLMLEGIGGCGKSTVMKVTQLYWPPHLRGILSSNMQPQFGMAAVARDGRSKAIFCNEVSESLQVVQEEWQTSVSGEWGSYAVKNQQEPLTFKWKAQHFWVGNQFPKKFNNMAGQVSRRLAGVRMSHPVQPRDGTIFDRIRSHKLGALQRKMTLAYHEFRRLHGTTDPMSAPDRLPPAFAEYYRRGIRETNPFEEFASNEDYIAVDPQGVMLLDDLRDLYNTYLQDHGRRSNVRWSEDLYMSTLASREARVVRPNEIVIDGVTHARRKVVLGLRVSPTRQQAGGTLVGPA